MLEAGNSIFIFWDAEKLIKKDFPMIVIDSKKRRVSIKSLHITRSLNMIIKLCTKNILSFKKALQRGRPK